MRTLVKYLKCERENCERLGQTFFEEEAKKRYFEEEKIFKEWFLWFLTRDFLHQISVARM